MLKRISLTAVLMLFLINCLFAQTKKPIDIGETTGKDSRQSQVITTSVPFLLVAPDSRSAGMGDIGVISSADANSQHHNPAKYVFNKDIFGISLSYSPWLRKLTSDINLLYLTAFYKITSMDAIAFSLRYFSLGEILFTIDGNEFTPFNPNEFAIDLTYSRKLTKTLSLALTPRFIYSNLTVGQFVGGTTETQAGVAGAADLSLFYEQDFKVKGLRNSTVRVGFNISNMGNKISYTPGSTRRDFLPTNLKFGIGYSMDFDEYNSLSIMGEVGKLLVPTPPSYLKDTNDHIVYDASNAPVIAKGKDPNVSVFMGMIQSFYDAPGGFKEEMKEFVWALGLEYSYRDLLFIRTGYFNESRDKGGRRYFTVGAGVHYSIVTLDVSYLASLFQNHPLENTLRFSLSFNFASFKKDEIKNQGRLK